MQMIWHWRPLKLWRLDCYFGRAPGFYGWRMFVQVGPLHLYAWPCSPADMGW